ncbi:MAG: glycosyltransferase family 4 protein [Candidatus Poseidoniales archaeon]|tara:strand:- start:2647 stop:3804 length:1158 start_codon:yes stop_codon:yes gene_type:complete
MKILQGCVRYPPAPGGAETVVKAYSEGLRDLGHDVEVITTDLYTETPFVKKEMPSEVNGINVTRHKAYTVSGEAHYVLAPGMVQSFLSKKADIIHTHSYGYFQNHAGWIRERFQSTPWVITPHFHPSWSMWGGAKRKTLREFYDTVIGKGTMESADLITCVSKHERDMLVSEIGISEDNIKIIYNGINWNDWKILPDKNIFRKQYPDISDKFVLFAGRLATNKGLSDLISAMDLVNQKSVDLVITGADMGLGKQLEKEASEKGVRMHRLGHIDDETYRSVLAAAEMLVLPSEYEAFGIVLLEAAAAETAVIGTNVGGIPEAMSPGNNGLIVEYNDVDNLSKSIATLLDDAKMCKEMGKAGRVWAKNFSWDSILKELEQEYSSIIR